MDNANYKNDAAPRPPVFRRTVVPKGVSLAKSEMIKTGHFSADQPLPLVIKPNLPGLNLFEWLKNSGEFVEANLLRYGAILFRGFKLKGAADLEGFVEASSSGLLPYHERSSPRHAVSDKVYTSTDYPPEYAIFPHNEHSYCRTLPLRLHFLCVRPAAEGGQTPLADTRRIFQGLNPEVRERFMRKGYMYVRNYGEGLGLPWQTVYQTSEKGEVEAYCRRNDIQWQWKSGDRLRTQQVRPVAARHPKTGEWVWFNHATFFHVSTLEAKVREAIEEQFAEEDLPNQTYYGDGAGIEKEVMEELRAAYEKEAVRFEWEAGDLVVLDNMLTAHARGAYRGERKVLFAMSEAYTREDF